MRLAKPIHAIIVGLGFGLLASAANATLIDNTTYTTDTAFGLDWLDLSATDGQSVASALLSNPGWSYANEGQVSNFLSSFGIAYAFTPATFTALSPTVPQVTSFQTLLGITATTSGGNASLGSYFNPTVSHSTYLCISNGGCAPPSFTNDVDLSLGDPQVGIFLVRASAVSAVPEPATLALFGAGLLGLGALRRRKTKV